MLSLVQSPAGPADSVRLTQTDLGPKQSGASKATKGRFLFPHHTTLMCASNGCLSCS